MQTTNSRVYLVCIGLALLSLNYQCRLTSTLSKPETSLRRTVGVGPDGIRLRRSSLYMYTSYMYTPPGLPTNAQITTREHLPKLNLFRHFAGIKGPSLLPGGV